MVALTSAVIAPSQRFVAEYIDSGGHVVQALLSVSSQVRFEYAPVQQSFKGRVGFAGLWWMATTRSHVGFESWLKRDQLIVLDQDPAVIAVALRPLSILFEVDGVRRRHSPDYFVRLADGTAVVIDVESEAAAKRPRVSRVVAAAADEVGWEYRTVSRIDPVLMANLRWLAGYRHSRCADPGLAAALCEALSAPLTVEDGVAAVGDRLTVLPTLFHLLWRGVLTTDLSAGVLSVSTIVHAPGRVSP